MDRNMQEKIEPNRQQRIDTLFAAMMNSEKSKNKRKLLKDITQESLRTKAILVQSLVLTALVAILCVSV